MPRPGPRPRYFRLTTCLVGPDVQLRRTADYRSLLRWLNAQLHESRVDLLSFCLVPRAMHLVIAARGRRTLDGLVGGVSTSRLRRFAATAGRPGSRRNAATADRPGSRRFAAKADQARSRGPSTSMPVVVRRLEKGVDVVNQCAFVERRAVALGLVRHVQDWPWSSAAERFRLHRRVPLRQASILMSQAWLDHLNAPRPTDASARCGDFADPPGGFTGVPQAPDHPVEVRRRAHENQPDTHVERPEHLVVTHATGFLKPREQRRRPPAAAIE